MAMTVQFIMHNLMNHFCVGTKPMKGNEGRRISTRICITIPSKSLQLLERERDQNRFFVQIVLEESSSRCCFVLLMLTIAFLFLAALGKTQLCMKRVKSGFILLQDISFFLVVVKYIEYSGRR